MNDDLFRKLDNVEMRLSAIYDNKPDIDVDSIIGYCHNGEEAKEIRDKSLNVQDDRPYLEYVLSCLESSYSSAVDALDQDGKIKDIAENKETADYFQNLVHVVKSGQMETLGSDAIRKLNIIKYKNDILSWWSENLSPGIHEGAGQRRPFLV